VEEQLGGECLRPIGAGLEKRYLWKMKMEICHISEDGERWRWGTVINQKMEKDGDEALA